MKYIEKGNAPRIFSDAARRAAGNYDNILSSDKKAMLEHLLDEQGYICAYCNKRIDEEKAHIEHLFPRNPENPELSDRAFELSCDYHNLLAVCDGNEGKDKKHQTCDKSKGNMMISISPLDKEAVDTIYYAADGNMYSSAVDYDRDIQKVLNLNADSHMVENRKAVCDGIRKWMENSRPSRQQVERKLQHYQERNADGRYEEYLAVAVYFLKRKLDRWN